MRIPSDEWEPTPRFYNIFQKTAGPLCAHRVGGASTIHKESYPGADDAVILEIAQREQRVLVTSDTDFGELAFRSGPAASCGRVLIRLGWTDPEADNHTVVTALSSRDDWSGIFAGVERDRVRVRALPPRFGTT
jgi:predicted nuclease of predicted toxin-antitoxin system